MIPNSGLLSSDRCEDRETRASLWTAQASLATRGSSVYFCKALVGPPGTLHSHLVH